MKLKRSKKSDPLKQLDKISRTVQKMIDDSEEALEKHRKTKRFYKLVMKDSPFK